jgi:eukaryotic-like serine/threonine-protein kinase
MGEVYRARDTKLNRLVALKVLPSEFALDADRVARFKREAQVLASLDHPNIAAIYGIEDSEGMHALVLQLVEGPTLADRIAEGPIPIDEALPIVKQIAEALEAAHDQGIIHRDLKPANIKVTAEGTVKVLDFGLAKLLDAETAPSSQIRGSSPQLTNSPTITTPAITMAGVILGTAAYMSPEQAKGRPADKRSDIWAYGCVLYEMLTGKRAFDGEDVSDTLASVLKGEPDLTLLPPDVPAAARTLIQRCLAKDRRQRVGDIAVARFVLSETGPAAAPSAGAAATHGVPWKLALAMAASVVVTTTVAAAVAWSLRPASARPQPIRFTWTLSQRQASFLIARQSMAISSDGTQIVYVAGNELYKRALSDLDASPISGTFFGQTTAVMSPAISPDGRSVAFWADNSIRRIPIAGGVASTVCPAAAPSGLSWDQSGLVFGVLTRGVWRCAPSGGAPQQLATVNSDEQAHGPHILPNGTALLFTVAKAEGGPSRWDRAQIVWQSLTTGERKTVISGGSDGRHLPTGHLLYAVGGTILAAPFDAQRGVVLGDAVPVVEGVRRSLGGTVGTAHLVTSATGVLAYMPGSANAATNQSIAIADRTGNARPLPLLAGPYVGVRASRAGTTLAIASDDGSQAHVWIAHTGTDSAARRLTFDGRNRSPVPSPDGTRVAYQSDREGDQAIFIRRTDGTGAVDRMTKPAAGESHVPESWSPDGKYLSYSAGKPGGFGLWVLTVGDKKAIRLGDIESRSVLGSSFSPDGRWIAYYLSPSTGQFLETSRPTNEVGQLAIRPLNDVGQVSSDVGVFIQPFPPTGARYQVPKHQIDFHPVWSPDGKSLFFTPSANSGRLDVIAIATQPTVTFGTVESLPARVTADRIAAEGRAWDILPDGRFVGIVPQSSTSGFDAAGTDTQIRFVLNWFEELKQRVPTK